MKTTGWRKGNYKNRWDGWTLTNHLLQALEVRNKIFTGAGTVRTLAPGTTFTLHGHAGYDLMSLAGATAPLGSTGTTADTDNTFVVLRVIHRAHNNLNADLHAQVERALGTVVTNGPDGDDAPGARPLYRNCIDAIRSHIPYRSPAADNHGRALHPKPRAPGQQSAIVVGSGGPVHTDRDHRVKVQFHWQRGANSHSRLAHPNPDGHTGAPADDRAGTWVRVATPLAPIAGANWGSHALPRVGQEVLITFAEGDIDRPVVVGGLYNGRGQDDAQNNQVSHGTGSATGNAPAWFPGEKEGHAHPAALSGIKSQALAASQAGNGAYSQLVFDDSPGQSRTVLQHHAQPHHGTAELNLGHLRHQTDNQRLAPAGFGAELKTRHSAALRAGAGLLMTTDARRNASGTQLDSREAQAQIEHGHQLQTALASTAQKHNAKLKDEPAAEKLPAIAQMQHSIDVVKSTAATDNPVTAYSEPHLQLSSTAGIAAGTPANAILTAGHTSSLTAGHDINLAAQGGSCHLVKDGISLFTYGKAGNNNKPNQETGIKLHAASGKITCQSQSDQTKLTADKTITVASITKSITIAASKHVLLTAGGAYIKLAGGNIEIHGPGAMAFKASMRELAGPAGGSVAGVSLPVPSELYLKPTEEPHSLRFAALGADEMLGLSGWAGHPFSIVDRDGKAVAQGTVAEDGRLPRVTTPRTQSLTLRLGDPKGAQLVPGPSSAHEPISAMPSVDEDSGEEETLQSASTENSDDAHAASHVIANRYFKEVLGATSHHRTEFLSESAVAELLNKANAS
ncbi:MAG: DUF2345 domain-containing protein [Gammaproteobacteria bacterium]